VTPAGIDLNGASFNNDNYGVNDVVVDPARPSDLYAFVNHQGVFKSTDYGVTFTGPINTGTGGAMVTAGKPWTAAIDPNPNRDPATPPTLWTAAGNAAVGVLKSVDGAVSWTAHPTGNATAAAASGNSYFGEDAYALDVDPYDSQHLLSGFHGYPGLSESTNGGLTWTTIAVPAGLGTSVYPFFIDTGNAATTRGNWFTVAQQNGANDGAWHTSNGGAQWAKVGAFEHFHGNSQVASLGNGVAYVGAAGGVFQTVNAGAAWTQVSTTDANGVVATPTRLYATFGWATNGAWDPHFQSAAVGAPSAWSGTPTPAAMTNGWKRAAVTVDPGGHRVIVAGCWNAGLWRYVEP
jgi:hypothetical protein